MKCKKKPVIVEAYQTDKEMIIHTLEGDMKANAGDYIITGTKGEQYPVRKDIFEEIYEPYTNTEWEEIDKEKIARAVVLLDMFTKTFCRYQNDYERFNDLKFRCDECPFQEATRICLVKAFKKKYAPDYRDFGSMVR